MSQFENLETNNEQQTIKNFCIFEIIRNKYYLVNYESFFYKKICNKRNNYSYRIDLRDKVVCPPGN